MEFSVCRTEYLNALADLNAYHEFREIFLEWSKFCDGQLDCGSGDDELFCDGQCPENEGFLCASGGYFRPCIPSSWKCDGFSDCLSGEDEDASECYCVKNFKTGGLCLFSRVKGYILMVADVPLTVLILMVNSYLLGCLFTLKAANSNTNWLLGEQALFDIAGAGILQMTRSALVFTFRNVEEEDWPLWYRLGIGALRDLALALRHHTTGYILCIIAFERAIMFCKPLNIRLRSYLTRRNYKRLAFTFVGLVFLVMISGNVGKMVDIINGCRRQYRRSTITTILLEDEYSVCYLPVLLGASIRYTTLLDAFQVPWTPEYYWLHRLYPALCYTAIPALICSGCYLVTWAAIVVSHNNQSRSRASQRSRRERDYLLLKCFIGSFLVWLFANLWIVATEIFYNVVTGSVLDIHLEELGYNSQYDPSVIYMYQTLDIGVQIFPRIYSVVNPMIFILSNKIFLSPVAKYLPRCMTSVFMTGAASRRPANG